MRLQCIALICCLCITGCGSNNVLDATDEFTSEFFESSYDSVAKNVDFDKKIPEIIDINEYTFSLCDFDNLLFKVMFTNKEDNSYVIVSQSKIENKDCILESSYSLDYNFNDGKIHVTGDSEDSCTNAYYEDSDYAYGFEFSRGMSKDFVIKFIKSII